MRAVRPPSTPNVTRRLGSVSRSIFGNNADPSLKLAIIAGFVLFVFWGGVVVGVGFSHGHEGERFPPGSAAWIRSTKKGSSLDKQKAVPPLVSQDAERPLRGLESRAVDEPCCIEATAECQSCRERLPISTFCFQKPQFAGCETVIPASLHSSLFSGSLRYELASDALDYHAITLSAWIFLSSTGPQQMRTILANRASGCVQDSLRHGYALYINEWNTGDMSINLNWYDESNACAQLSTPPRTVQAETWHHIGATLESAQGRTKAKIYVDGVLKADKEFSSARVLASSPHKFVVGAHGEGAEEHPFFGKLAHVAVAEGVSVAMASSFPEFMAKDPRVNLKSYWKDFPKDLATVSDASGNSLSLARVSTTFDNSDAPGGFSIPFVIPLGSDAEMGAGLWPPDDFRLTKDLKTRSDELARERRDVVRNAMKHAWRGYETRAFGADELLPRSGSSRNNWGGMAVTLVDSLDTLWIMGLKDEFYRARDYCRDRLRFDTVGSVSVFETTIRVLGGLLSAYDLSKDRVFLDRAKELGDRLSRAFGTPSGLPVPSIALSASGEVSGGNSIIAEVGTLQLEFRSLAFHTGETKYATLVENVHKKMREAPPDHGLWPINVDLNTGHSSGGMVSFGAMGDSFFEYLLKVWVQGGRIEPEYLADYEAAMDGLHEVVLQKSSGGHMYVPDMHGSFIRHRMEHLTCFVPGMLALGVKKRGDESRHAAKNKRDLTVAKALTYTCVQMYERQPTGISPEYVNMGRGGDFEVPADAPWYVLRPEAVESLYILHSITGHPVYRDWGHRIMMNMEKYLKLPYGYGAHPDVRDPKRQLDDKMESFYLAETLKYLYLLQDPDSEINLDDWVFNTEAHPLRVLPPGWRQKIGL